MIMVVKMIKLSTTTSDFLIVYDSDVVNFACQETSWVIDSGASIHATPRKDFFTSYTSGDFGSVRMGNDGSAKAIGMGDVCLETSNGTMLTLKNVKHIPDIRMNLISIGKLDDEGFCNTFRDSQWKLTRVDDDSTFELWHNRLGHMSEKGLMILAKKNLLSGMKKGSLKRCAHCLAGKADPELHSKHFTIQGSQFHALVERQSGEKLKCIRTDNGGEYSGPFDEYCKQHGIRHQKTPPKTPQLNGLAERMNMTLEFGQIMKSLMIICVSLDARLLCIFPKDERSKLDAKTRPYVFIGYVRMSLDIEKTNPMESQHSGDLIDLDPAPLTNLPTQVEDEAHDDQNDMASLDLEIQQMDVKTAFLHEAVKQILCHEGLGLVKRILGIRIERDRASKKLCMLQEQYIEKVLARFSMSKAKVKVYFRLFDDILRRCCVLAIETTEMCALSTTEVEYIAAAEACKELLWMKCFMQELGFKQQRYVVYCENQSAIHLSKNSTYHARSKHIDVRYHWMRDALNDNLFEIEKIRTDNNGSDMLTKTLPREKLGVCCSIARMSVNSASLLLNFFSRAVLIFSFDGD
ncbi:Retrovirus-related Pol polyprotein from transposon TNT 1-94 [Vitis vinifera]|uniref:Retrovirus-related Pol polyprotein from transposon TNT 1-94 n=1 Tax=Vitis vinifera TaxID=29760 RepID=A0A438FRR2_VITVI|nr:Retrovirus-related Pol polyprotein from transposon TNT 1-94 [Vitis vinifera]